MLWDRYPELPYQAVVPWPRVYTVNSQLDWSSSVDLVQSWLESRVGSHWVNWTWTCWSLDQSDLCSVNFRHSQHSLLFLLRWGD